MNSASKLYINGITAAIITLLIITGIVFLLVLANRLDIVMNSKPAITYTYFVMIMDRIIAFVFILSVIPLSVFQWFSKDKMPADKIISGFSVLLILVFCSVLLFGECHFYDKYKNGELDGAVLFASPVFEMKIFDRIK